MVRETQSDTQDEPLRMTQSEAVAVTGFSRSTIAKWVREGTIPVFFIAGRRYIRRDLFMAWLDQRTTGGEPPGDK